MQILQEQISTHAVVLTPLTYILVGKKNLPVPEAKGGKVYRYWIVLNFHTTRRYMKLVEISY